VTLRAAAAALCIALTLQAAGTAGAHQQKEAVTRVLFNPRTGNVEVMHRFLVHDVEHALEQTENRPADVLGSEADRARFAAYVHDRFSITDGGGAPLALTPVGLELDGKFLWVYAEAPIRPGLERLLIRHGALRDVWRDQVNLVNVERDGVVRSAVFSGATQEAQVAF
jgi:hypothetical protein